jgi:IS30 family transposase
LKGQARKWARDRNNAICDWHAEGASLRQIADALEMSPGTIQRIVKDGRRGRR